MEIIPFSLNYDEDYNTVYKFRWKPDTISKEKPYETEIIIDELNDSLVVSKKCSCAGNMQFKKECKHIRESLLLLTKYGVEYRYG
jgi:hypothetical protein